MFDESYSKILLQDYVFILHGSFSERFNLDATFPASVKDALVWDMTR